MHIVSSGRMAVVFILCPFVGKVNSDSVAGNMLSACVLDFFACISTLLNLASWDDLCLAVKEAIFTRAVAANNSCVCS